MIICQAGYLDLDIDGTSPTIKIINVSLILIAFLIQCTIGAIAMVKMRTSKTSDGDVGMLTRMVFLFSVFCACVFMVTLLPILLLGHLEDAHEEDVIDTNHGDRDVTQTNERHVVHEILIYFHLMSLGCLFLSLLTSLILKLYVTFKNSVYSMSSVLIHSFSILIAVYFVVLTIFCALWSFMSGTHPIVLSILFILLVLIFVMGSALSIFFFIQTLKKLVEARELALAGNVMRTNHLRRRDFKLDTQQQALANLSSKYVMLFTIAVVTTILTQIAALSVNFSSGLRSTICALNLCIVSWCLYLQFTFAKDHYQKSCGCCDTRCTSAISRKSQRRIHEQVMSMMHGRLSNSNTPRSRSTPRSVSSQTGSPRSHIRMVSDDLTVNLD